MKKIGGGACAKRKGTIRGQSAAKAMGPTFFNRGNRPPRGVLAAFDPFGIAKPMCSLRRLLCIETGTARVLGGYHFALYRYSQGVGGKDRKRVLRELK